MAWWGLPNLALDAWAQTTDIARSSAAGIGAGELSTMYFPHSQFKIPFNVESRGSLPTQVQLWVSTDEGASWQMHGATTADRRAFDFRAAAEGAYLFSVQTVDENGKVFPSPHPPMRILIDTTKPNVAVKADVNSSNQVVVDIRISEEHLKLDSVRLRYRTDQEAQWQEVAVNNIVAAGQVYEGQVLLDLKNCREVGLVVTVEDEASNQGEAVGQFTLPRVASASQDMKLASQRNGAGNVAGPAPGPTSMPGAVAWPAPPVASVAPGVSSGRPTSVIPPRNAQGSRSDGWQVSGQLANGPAAEAKQGLAGGTTGLTAPSGTASVGPTLSLEPSLPLGPDANENQFSFEELPTPPAMDFKAEADGPSSPVGTFNNLSLDAATPSLPKVNEAIPEKASSPAIEPSSLPTDQAYHCNARTFSLDYELNAAAGSMLADIELWGTEDGGISWQKWGADPDRQSPFDVQVANDGLFGFRMVIISQNGKVSNRPQGGDSADSWINVDSERPAAKITRAVYGEGSEAGMLVIDYNCSDSNLHDHPVTLSYSETRNGPWITIATSLKNDGRYVWKADPNLPGTVFLRLEVLDRAGNVGSHLLDLPVNIQGLMPRGRIQGFRPITNP